MWKIYALLSALFAALTAVFAKAGVKDINSDLAFQRKYYQIIDLEYTKILKIIQ